jgi:UDPglucose 6-dehydrogenase
LLNEGAHVVGYDPEASQNAKAALPDLEIAGDPYEALDGSHCAVLCTEWEEFSALDLDRMKACMAYPVMVDGRNLFDAEDMSNAGFTYRPTGRPGSLASSRQ